MIDVTSPTWRHIKAAAEKEIESMKNRLCGDLDQVQTTRLRAEIKRLKWLLELPDQQASPEPESEVAFGIREPEF